MHNYTTNIILSSIEDIYNMRSKIYDVVGLLSNERIEPSRISSRLSSLLREELRQKDNINLEVTLNESKQSVALEMMLNQQKITAFNTKYYLNNENYEAFDKAVEILSQKSKEELERELRESAENLQRTNVEKARMEQELNVAKEIQLSMLPLDFPAFPDRKDIDIYAHLIPAKEVGGDFYDFYFIDEDNICFTVGDVSGKGVPAALMMAVCKTLIKSRAGIDKSTASVLTFVNDEMAKDNKNFMFVTIFMAILNTKTGKLTYTNAGHNPTYIRSALPL